MQKTVSSFDGTKINYDIDEGYITTQIKPILIFVHGAGGNLRAWDEERIFLRQLGIKTLAIDLRGHGLSDRPHKINDYSLKKFARDIYAIIKQEKIKNFVIVAHCFGGMVTVDFHRFFPKLAKGYVLVDSAPKAPQILKDFIKNNPYLINLLNRRLHKKNNNDKKFRYLNYKRFIGTGDWNIRRIYNDITHTSFKSWFFTFQNLAKFNGVKILKSIHQPVLIINGEKDSIFEVKIAQKINLLIKNSHLHIIPDANHVLVINNPKILAKNIASFVQKLDKL